MRGTFRPRAQRSPARRRPAADLVEVSDGARGATPSVSYDTGVVHLRSGFWYLRPHFFHIDFAFLAREPLQELV